MDMHKWAVDQANEYIATVKWYISEGMTKEWAIDTVFNSSVLGKKYKDAALEIIEQGYWNQLVAMPTREEIDQRIDLRREISKASKSASLSQLRQALEILRQTEEA